MGRIHQQGTSKTRRKPRQRKDAKPRAGTGKPASGRNGRGRRGGAAAKPLGRPGWMLLPWKRIASYVGAASLALAAAYAAAEADSAGWARVAEAHGAGNGYSPVDMTWPINEGTGSQLLPASVRQTLKEQILAASAGSDASTHDALARVGAVLDGSGWIDGRPTVVRQPDGCIRVDVTWRWPVATVRWRGQDHWITGRGFLMPYAVPMNRGPLPVIDGAVSGPISASAPEASSEPWPDQRVLQSLELLVRLQNEVFGHQVAGIEIESDRDHALVIVSDRGGRVVWGGAIGEYNPGERTTEEKLARLRRLHSTHGRFDADRPLVEVYGPVLVVK